MKVRVKRATFSGVPRNWLLIGDSDRSQVFLTIGKELEVHAMVVFEGSLAFCVIDDNEMFTWKYSWMFEVLDGLIPSDWIVRSLTGPYERTTIIGPEFLSSNNEAYEDFVEQVPAAIRKMWDRWDQIQRDRAEFP